MDDITFKSHFRLTRDQFEVFSSKLSELGNNSRQAHTRLPMKIKAAMFLWYMANQNSFREIGNNFGVARSTAHDTIEQILEHIATLAADYIKWPNQQDKETSAGVFRRLSGKNNVIGAIDGTHIRILKPKGPRGVDYYNRNKYHSMLLQGICDDTGKFLDVFTGPPGRVHDARMLRESDFFRDWQMKMGNYFLLGDTAYKCAQFPFIIAPKKDVGTLTAEDIADNTRISKGRVIIENVFGRLKCRWRRLKEMQNVDLTIMVRIILAACVLHNMCMQLVCEEHPNGCPRLDDHND